jgi:RNA polymerase sigma-70 factor (ECF subfamily)
LRVTSNPVESAEPPARSTLGGLLYADAARPRIPESEWSALVFAVAKGDARSLRSLYDRAHRLVFTLALRITGSRETAEELTVDVFYGVWQRAASYDAAAGTVIAWLMNLARSRAIDRLRHDQRQKRVNLSGRDLHEDNAVDVAALAVHADNARALQQAMTSLTADERRAIETAYYADMSHAEVAARLREPLGTIKTRIRSALAKLRRALGPGDGR